MRKLLVCVALCAAAPAWGQSNARRINGYPVCAGAPTANAPLMWDATAGCYSTAVAAASAYSCSIANSAGPVTCTHNLGTSQPWVSCYDASGNMLGSSGASTSVTSVVASSASAAAITFSGAEANRVCLISTGGMGPKGDTGATGATGPAGGGMLDSGGDGIVKRTAVNTTTPAVAGTDYYAPGGAIAGSDFPAVSAGSATPGYSWAPFGIVSSCSNLAMVNNLIARVLFVPAKFSVHQIRSYVAVVNPAGGGNRWGVYSSAGSLLAESSVDTTTSGVTVKTYTFSPALTLTPGFYWLVWGADNTTVAICTQAAAGDTPLYSSGLTGTISGKTIQNGFTSLCSPSCGTGGSFSLPSSFAGLDTPAALAGSATGGSWSVRIE